MMRHGKEDRQLVELRTKLEQRTWILRASVALNCSLIGGILTGIVVKLWS